LFNRFCRVFAHRAWDFSVVLMLSTSGGPYASVPTTQAHVVYFCAVMMGAHAIGPLIDQLERTREELLVLQQSLEKHEAKRDGRPKNGIIMPMPDKPTSEQIRREAIELRETAAKLIAQAASLIQRSVALEKQISKPKRDGAN